jgi:hypothetical protein
MLKKPATWEAEVLGSWFRPNGPKCENLPEKQSKTKKGLEA